MATADSVKVKLQGLITKANETTGNTDADLTTAVNALVAGFGQGGEDTSIEDGLVEGTLTTYRNDRITKVRSNAFYGCAELSDVTFLNVTEVGGHAFEYSGCVTFFLPKLTTSGDSMFRNSKIVSVTDENIPMFSRFGNNSAFRDCAYLKYFQHSAEMDYGGRNIETCTVLEKVDIYAKSLTYYVFNNCKALTALILRKSDSICTLSNTNAITGTPIVNGTGYVYVPSSLIEEYKVATNWATYADQFRAIEDYPEICEVGA